MRPANSARLPPRAPERSWAGRKPVKHAFPSVKQACMKPCLVVA